MGGRPGFVSLRPGDRREEMTAPTLVVVCFVGAVLVGFSLVWGSPVYAIPIVVLALAVMAVIEVVRRIRRPARVAKEEGLAPEHYNPGMTAADEETLVPGTRPPGERGVRSGQAQRLAEEHREAGVSRRSPETRRSHRPWSGRLAGAKLAPEGNSKTWFIVPEGREEESE